jgi:transcriptional regulator GlxA family with amidase domain
MKTKLGILLYENVQPMDVIGPWEVLSFWQSTLKAPIDMYLISQDGAEVKCVNNITLKAHLDFKNSPQFDYFIVPGGPGRNTQVNNETVISFIQKQAKGSKYIISICTGMFLLHKAGILDDKKITTYWRALPELQALSNVKIVEERIVKDGNIWMSGGVSSGIDLAFELIKEIAGTETAGKVQLLFEYFPRDVVYCTPDMIHSLPPYDKHKDYPSYLPEYIQNYIKLKKQCS